MVNNFQRSSNLVQNNQSRLHICNNFYRSLHFRSKIFWSSQISHLIIFAPTRLLFERNQATRVFTVDTNAASNVNSVRNINSNTSAKLGNRRAAIGTGIGSYSSVSLGAVSALRQVFVSGVQSSWKSRFGSFRFMQLVTDADMPHLNMINSVTVKVFRSLESALVTVMSWARNMQVYWNRALHARHSIGRLRHQFLMVGSIL